MGLGVKTASRRFIRSTFLELGYHAGEKSTPSEILALVRKLRPLDCGIELIRVGSDFDGGYLIPDDLEGIEYCFSPGVSAIADFESQLAERHIHSFLADYSVPAPPIARPEFTFDKKYLGAVNEGPFWTLARWKDKYLKDYAGDLILQMDIEGAEYEVLLSTPDLLLDQFRIVVVEFHELGRLIDAFNLRFMSSCFEKLLQSFFVVHIHPNDCSEIVRFGEIEIPTTLEITLLHKRRARQTKPRMDFPHRLDASNHIHGKQVPLAKIWYS